MRSKLPSQQTPPEITRLVQVQNGHEYKWVNALNLGHSELGIQQLVKLCCYESNALFTNRRRIVMLIAGPKSMVMHTNKREKQAFINTINTCYYVYRILTSLCLCFSCLCFWCQNSVVQCAKLNMETKIASAELLPRPGYALSTVSASSSIVIILSI